jgi:hypothetical protein
VHIPSVRLVSVIPLVWPSVNLTIVDERDVYFVSHQKSIRLSLNCGKRNKDGIPLPRLLIFGKNGQREVKEWVKEWLK